MTTTDTTFALPEGVRVHHATLAKATRLDAMLRAEYPALSLTASADPTDDAKAVWSTYHTNAEGEATQLTLDTKLPDLADVLLACEEADLDPEEAAAEDDEPKVSGSVVPEHYRQQYRAASTNGQTCGDWLAEWLVAETTTATGLNVEDLTAIFVANGLDLSKGWGTLPTSGQKGWVGRYRMNGRQVLEKVVAKTGLVRDAFGTAVFPPEDFLATMRTKHSKWLAKEAKLLAAALATAGKEEAAA